ncbi:anti-sigma factor [Rhizobium sp. BG4]|uniref:anti-sigma factor family protein n=1 Tax=Rhizobium sp. BG4 TaxID=2613770 RepID=UPI00193E9487|nr:anti-sigma factor [Rhizobium sp. BG4]QRM46834.1 anti-sigma factor [Rhizobium sp. BG4]
MTRKPITEDDLQGYVDDVLDAERHREVSDYLQGNPEAAARLSSYASQVAALRSAMDPVMQEPVPSRLNLTHIAAARRPRARAGFAPMAAAAMALLAVGATGGWLVKGMTAPATEGVAMLAQEASASYGTFASDKVRPVEVRANESDTLKQLASSTLGASAVIPDLSKAGYRLMGGRVVSTLHGPGVMLMYDNDHGSRLVMLSRKMLVDQNRPMIESSSGAVNGWSWANDGLGYSLVGSLPSNELHSFADDVRSQVTTAL